MKMLRESFPVLLLALGTAGCPADGTTEVRCGPTVLQASFRGSGRERTVDLEGALPGDGTSCVQVRFWNEQRATTGTWIGTLPAQGVSVPEASVRWTLVKCVDDEAPDAAPPSAESGLNDSGTISFVPSWFLAGGPVEFEPLVGATSHAITARVRSQREATQLAARLLEAASGQGAVTWPAEVFRIHQLARMVVVGTDVTFTFAGRTPFEELTFDLNGAAGHRSLDDADLTQAGELHRATITVPLADFQQGAMPGASYRNNVLIRLRNAGEHPVVTSSVWETTAL